MLTFAIHAYEDEIEAIGFGPLKAEIEKRGFRCMIVRSPKTKTKTPNQDRAKVMVEALRDVQGAIVLIGLSNQGLFMPLVAAARPIRQITMINAAIPQPGKSFKEACDFKKVFASWPVRLLARHAPAMSEVCPLTELPQVDYVYICGEKDDAIRPEWEQWAAREYLHVEPIVIKGAGHSTIILNYIQEVVDAATKTPSTPREKDSKAPTQLTGNIPHPLSSLMISHLGPLIAYFAVRPHVASDTEALAIAWFIPVVWTLGFSLWLRRLDPLGILGIFVYGIALSISIFFGVGALPLKLRKAIVSGAISLVCLGSAAIGKPVFLFFTRHFAKGTERGLLMEAALADPRVVQKITNRLLIIGSACLASAALKTALAILLSTSAFLIATTIMHIAVVAGIAIGLLIYAILYYR